MKNKKVHLLHIGQVEAEADPHRPEAPAEDEVKGSQQANET